jgi:hypothetical protein
LSAGCGGQNQNDADIISLELVFFHLLPALAFGGKHHQFLCHGETHPKGQDQLVLSFLPITRSARLLSQARLLEEACSSFFFPSSTVL